MDVDNPDPMARLAQYAVPAQEDGPSRKRPSLFPSSGFQAANV